MRCGLGWANPNFKGGTMNGGRSIPCEKKQLFIILFVALISLALVDRYLWSLVAQWREDQSTIIWIASTFPISEWYTGLISSKGIPNPNGFFSLAIFLALSQIYQR